MTQLLLAKKHIPEIKKRLAEDVASLGLEDSYLAIVFLGENTSSETYVRMKRRFGENIGLSVKVFWQDRDDDQLIEEKVTELIESLNKDSSCVGVVIQLPLPPSLFQATNRLYSKIAIEKDVDGLGGALMGYASIGLIDFLPATPGAVLRLLSVYGFADFQWKKIAILWQSNLVGRPLAIEMMKRWWTILSFNEYSDQKEMKERCKKSDLIVSCTGKIHLVNDEFVRDDQTQVLVDVGYGHKDGKAVGDVYAESVMAKVLALTPVPWGVWPLTVAQLFINTIELQKKRLMLPQSLWIKRS